MDLTPLPSDVLPAGIRARFVDNGNGLRTHVLEAGFETPGRARLLLLHGFPELAYSWRKVMPALADAGYHVIAPDQRGYGRTTGWTDGYDVDLAPFRILNLVRDQIGLLSALGYRSVSAVIGHDFGSPVAAACALARPDVFHAVAMMSAPVAGAPAFPFGTADRDGADAAVGGMADPGLERALAGLYPPRKHYQWYYSTRPANADMMGAAQGLHAFLRAYFHMKSADWPANRPHRLSGWTAQALAELPTYYIMRADQTMAETVAADLPTAGEIAACKWMPEPEMAVFAQEYGRTGFQGGLNWYRCATGGLFAEDLRTFAGRAIDVPATFIAGASDWGIYQKPADFEAMQQSACTRFTAAHLIPGAGHWVQQEQPAAVVERLLAFLSSA